jgi:hypothetical protein
MPPNRYPMVLYGVVAGCVAPVMSVVLAWTVYGPRVPVR